MVNNLLKYAVNCRVLFPVLILLFVGLNETSGKENEKSVSNLKIRELGSPVRSVNWVRLLAGKNQKGDPCIYAAMGQEAEPLFVLQINPENGSFQQFTSTVSDANFPTARLMSRSGKFYVGASYAGHLLCFDPAKNALEDLGAIHPDAATFPCRLDEDAQGRIWIGSYGTADLTCYDPSNGKFTWYGRMDDTDMYNYPLVNTDGTIACMIRMTQPHVVVFDPVTGKKQVAGPVITKGTETLDLRRGNDGKLYIVSSLGNFRLEGTQTAPVETVPDPKPEPTLPDGSTFAFADAAEQINRVLEIRKPNGESKKFPLDYKASGNNIFYVHTGPDGNIYGSSILPLHLFRYSPKTGELVDLGKCTEASGEAYSMANLDGKMYISSYPEAMLTVYDPTKPYHYGKQADDNPRDLGRIDNISYRPRSTLTGPLGRVWLASIPDYGMWGGPLSYYDPKTDTKKAYYRIVGDGSCYTLAYLEDRGLIAVGTSTSGGSGTQPKVDHAVLFLWDPQAEKKVWEGTLDRHVSTFKALCYGKDKKLYGTVVGRSQPPELFVFDPQSQTFTKRIPLPPGDSLDLGLQNGPDGKLYGFTSTALYRLDPEKLTFDILIQDDKGFSVPGPILGEDIYFASGHRLRAVKLFE